MTAGLTYCALSGIQKQSVEDVERLFGLSLMEWMEKKGTVMRFCISELFETGDVLAMSED